MTGVHNLRPLPGPVQRCRTVGSIWGSCQSRTRGCKRRGQECKTHTHTSLKCHPHAVSWPKCKQWQSGTDAKAACGTAHPKHKAYEQVLNPSPFPQVHGEDAEQRQAAGADARGAPGAAAGGAAARHRGRLGRQVGAAAGAAAASQLLLRQPVLRVGTRRGKTRACRRTSWHLPLGDHGENISRAPGARLAGKKTVRLQDIRWLPKHQTRLPARPGSLGRSRRCFLEEPCKL